MIFGLSDNTIREETVLSDNRVATTTEGAKSRAPSVPTKQEAVVPVTEIAETKNLTLIAGEDEYPMSVSEGSTLYESMVSLASTTGFRFSAKEFSGLGYMIESINGKQNAGGFYWTLYINGVYATTGASTYRPKEGDKAEWRYEKL